MALLKSFIVFQHHLITVDINEFKFLLKYDVMARTISAFSSNLSILQVAKYETLQRSWVQSDAIQPIYLLKVDAKMKEAIGTVGIDAVIVYFRAHNQIRICNK